ncbi:MAG: RluA family pseudouridine synthase [Nannocystaceae bacterium]
MKGPTKTIRLGPEALGQRLDRALVCALVDAGESCTRSQLARVFAARLVRVDNRPVKASRVVDRELDVAFVLPEPEPLSAEPENIPLRIVWEDPHLLVVDKPPGMVVHPSLGHPGGTLVNAVLHYLGVGPEALPVLPGNDTLRPGIVHRIDRDTSGLLVVAKHMRAQEGLAKQFRDHTIERRYLAVCCGVPTWESLRVQTFHGRDPRDRRRYAPNVGPGRQATSNFERTQTLGEAAVLGCRLETGRTHQIRMHARHLGHPLIADSLYGPRAGSPRIRKLAASLGRHALHAQTLGFIHPISGEKIQLRAPLPEDLEWLLEQLAR